MATRQNTNNAIPSNDLKDLNDNTIIIDEWTNGTEDYTQDRLGNQIKTRKKVVEDLDAYAQQIADGLFVPLDGSKAAKKVKIGTTMLTGDDGILKADDVKLLKNGDAVQLTADENGVKTVAEATTFSGDVNATGALQNKGSDVVTQNTALTDLTPYMIGWGQTWQDVTSQRATGVEYINRTGKPIFIAVYYQNSDTTTTYMKDRSDGNTAAMTSGDAILINGFSNAHSMTITCIIPSGYAYKVVAQNINTWKELR